MCARGLSHGPTNAPNVAPNLRRGVPMCSMAPQHLGAGKLSDVDLSGCVAIIIGENGGIDPGMADALARDGCAVSVSSAADRTPLVIQRRSADAL